MLTLVSALFALAPLVPHEAMPANPALRPLERVVPALSCSIADVRSPQSPRRRHSFRATRIVELEFQARLHGRSKRARQLQLRVYTPGGFLYQVLELPLEPAASRRHALAARLPVAGTSIMASGLYGRWRVVPHLDGRREPCGRGRSFVIRP